jgi:membrane-associated phospholipid phosphatase
VASTAWVLAAAIVGPLVLAASLGEEVAEREPMGIDSAARSVAASPSGPWHGAMVLFSEIGAGTVPILLAALAVTACLRRGMRRHALFVVLAVEGAMAGGRVLKAVFERPRPATLPGGPLAGGEVPGGQPVLLVAALVLVVVVAWATPWRRAALLLGATASTWLAVEETWQRLIPLQAKEDSFPSGHAVGSMAVVAVVVVLTWSSRFRWAALLGGSVFTVAVGVSRVSLGYHFPSDVLAGWATAVAWTSACWLLVLRSPWGPAPTISRAPAPHAAPSAAPPTTSSGRWAPTYTRATHTTAAAPHNAQRRPRGAHSDATVTSATATAAWPDTKPRPDGAVPRRCTDSSTAAGRPRSTASLTTSARK